MLSNQQLTSTNAKLVQRLKVMETTVNSNQAMTRLQYNVMALLKTPSLAEQPDFLESDLKKQLEALFTPEIFLQSQPVQEKLRELFGLLKLTVFQVVSKLLEVSSKQTLVLRSYE